MTERSNFFFSSRRRHTRFDCDWSSDVCSSDLGDPDVVVADDSDGNLLWANDGSGRFTDQAVPAGVALSGDGRSEERRVGKECRSPRSPWQSRYNEIKGSRKSKMTYSSTKLESR